MDVAKVRKDIVKNLQDHGFRNRDADPTDFQFGTDPGLRFKVGTVKGEVAVTVWKHARQMKDVIRVLNEEQAIEAKHTIDALINDYFSRTRHI